MSEWKDPDVESPAQKPKLLEGEELIRIAYELGFYQPGRNLSEAIKAYRDKAREEAENGRNEL